MSGTPFDHRFPRLVSGLTSDGVYQIVAAMGKKLGVDLHPHAIRHTAVTEACKRAQAAGIGIDEVRQFSRHRKIETLMIYRDNDRDVQGVLSSLLAEGF